MQQVLIAGCGDVGNRLGRLLLAAGQEVFGVRRDVSALYPGIRGVAADLKSGAGLEQLTASCDTLVFAAAGAGREEASYRQLYVDGLRRTLERMPQVRRVLFTSSTAVYAQDDGSWVDESSQTAPGRFNGKVMLEAEGITLNAPGGQVLRLGGLYGPGRKRLLRLVEAGKPCVEHPPRYTNRIHCEDAARAAFHLLASGPEPETVPVVLGVDNAPAAEHEVRDWLARQIGVAPPARDANPASRSQNKRCRNTLLRDTGFNFGFPTFKEGYAEVLKARPRPA